MRYLFGLLLLPVLSLQAWAGDPPKPDVASAHHPRVTWEQHFTQANLTHDGHLTLEEAKGGYALVARHFDDIDADHKGYVTENDIRAWRVMRRAAHRLTQPPENKLKSGNVMQPGPEAHRPLSASAIRIMAIPSDPLAPRRRDVDTN